MGGGGRAIGQSGVEADVLEVLHLLQRHENALQAVRDLHRGHRESHSSRLLKVSELGDLLWVTHTGSVRESGLTSWACPDACKGPEDRHPAAGQGAARLLHADWQPRQVTKLGHRQGRQKVAEVNALAEQQNAVAKISTR